MPQLLGIVHGDVRRESWGVRQDSEKSWGTGYHDASPYGRETQTVTGLQHSRPLLVGSLHKVIVRTDHNNLRYWRDPQKISQRIAREVLELADYDIEIHHLQGKDNRRADALSRREDHDSGDHDNENVTVLPDHLFARATWVEQLAQNDDIIRRWVDPHRLKYINCHETTAHAA